MFRTPIWLLASVAVWLPGCGEVEETMQGLETLYNPCGPEASVEDCPGGNPADPDAGNGPLDGITGSRGEHVLEVSSLDCGIRLDSVGSVIDADLCPDCSLTLQMSHVNLDDGCGVGTFTYTSVIGLISDNAGAYSLYLSLDGSEWYAVGEATVQNGVLTYDAQALYDTTYGGYYGAYPAYGFHGTHNLTRD
ncbi:MAG TPA: hypothetical protein DFR83_26385 [Deltaproteobacteria bacterium]|nr:hypothetical protein [Deltaproteobacteria bacterium]